MRLDQLYWTACVLSLGVFIPPRDSLRVAAQECVGIGRAAYVASSDQLASGAQISVVEACVRERAGGLSDAARLYGSPLALPRTLQSVMT